MTSEVPQVDLTTAQVGGNVASKEILDLPSPTRNFISFVAMVPGVQLNPSAEGSDSLSINGQSNNQVNFVLDGGNNTDDNSASASGRPGAHAARGRAGIPGRHQPVRRRVRPHDRRRRQRHHQARHQRVPRIRLRLPHELGHDGGELLRQVRRTSKKATPTSISTAARSAVRSSRTSCTSSTASSATCSAGRSPIRFRPGRILNLTTQQGLNGYNHLVRIDGQINANNTYTGRYLTERQPNRDLYTGDRGDSHDGQLRARRRSDRERVLQPGHRQPRPEHHSVLDRDRAHPPRRRAR